MIKRVIKCCLLLLLASGFAYGQGENNMWCFALGKGLDFNGGPPVFFTNNMNTLEGCASVCDASGNLLFYASPNRVWDRNNNVMPNGNGLLGNTSTTQGAAIIQSFSNPNQYYLFTLMAFSDSSKTLHYSVVDMSLNGGYGDVIPGQKNILLDSDVSEKNDRG